MSAADCHFISVTNGASCAGPRPLCRGLWQAHRVRSSRAPVRAPGTGRPRVRAGRDPSLPIERARSHRTADGPPNGRQPPNGSAATERADGCQGTDRRLGQVQIERCAAVPPAAAAGGLGSLQSRRVAGGPPPRRGAGAGSLIVDGPRYRRGRALPAGGSASCPRARPVPVEWCATKAPNRVPPRGTDPFLDRVNRSGSSSEPAGHLERCSAALDCAQERPVGRMVRFVETGVERSWPCPERWFGRFVEWCATTAEPAEPAEPDEPAEPRLTRATDPARPLGAAHAEPWRPRCVARGISRWAAYHPLR